MCSIKYHAFVYANCSGSHGNELSESSLFLKRNYVMVNGVTLDTVSCALIVKEVPRIPLAQLTRTLIMCLQKAHSLKMLLDCKKDTE